MLGESLQAAEGEHEQRSSRGFLSRSGVEVDRVHFHFPPVMNVFRANTSVGSYRSTLNGRSFH